MPLPIAHSLVGASIIVLVEDADQKCKGWGMLLLGCGLANLPDADFFFVWILGLGSTWHRGFTHSACFATVSALAAVLLTGRRDWPSFAGGWLAALSHGVLDALTTKENLGVQLLWPMSSARYKAGAFDHWNYHIRSGVSGWEDFLLAALGIILLEALIFTPLFLAALCLRRFRHRPLMPARLRLQYIKITSKEGMALDHSTTHEDRHEEQSGKA